MTTGNAIVAGYVQDRKHAAQWYQTQRDEFEMVLRMVRRYRAPIASLLEIGVGTGWFQVQCRQAGIPCRGLEIDADLVASAHQLAEQEGVTLDLSVGNLDETDLGEMRYDVIVADSTFEHVRDWQAGLAKAYRALVPGGVLFFASTNKWTLRGGEYSRIPLYGYLPDGVRYWLRRRIQGPEIMDWGIDFNQFTHGQLRGVFRRIGFSGIHDRVDALDPEQLAHPTAWKKRSLSMLKRSRLLRAVALTFVPTTMFVCQKEGASTRLA